MEPSKQDLELTAQLRPEEKKRCFRLVKVEEQRFRVDRLEDRIAPGSGHTYHCSSGATSAGGTARLRACGRRNAVRPATPRGAGKESCP
jgi:hypothetical protein